MPGCRELFRQLVGQRAAMDDGDVVALALVLQAELPVAGHVVDPPVDADHVLGPVRAEVFRKIAEMIVEPRPVFGEVEKDESGPFGQRSGISPNPAGSKFSARSIPAAAISLPSSA